MRKLIQPSVLLLLITACAGAAGIAPNNNLYLSMDYPDRPDHLMDLVPQDVYRGFEFVKIQ